MTLEILDRAFVFLRRCPAVKRAEIFPLPRSRISLAGIQPILAGFQFSNHEYCSARCTWANIMLVAPRLQLPNQDWQAERPLYKGFLKRFEMPSARSEARIARLVAR